MNLELKGQLLISSPAIADPRFSRSVIYMVAHNGDGSFGLVFNRTIPGLKLADVLDQVGIDCGPATPDRLVLGGGPVETHRGFVLHSDDWPSDTEHAALPGGLGLSASIELLGAIARGEGPAQWLLALGYAGWGPGQLEDEIARNGWLIGDVDPGLLFEGERGDPVWSRALRGIGVNPLNLSARAGHA